MKNFNFAIAINISLLTFALLAFAPVIKAQEPSMSPQAGQDARRGGPLLRRLNLSPEQIKQLGAINRETRQTMRAAAQKQREARRALDLAIYANSPNEAEVEQRARELAEAQTNLTKLRARTEFRIRQILTPEQLATFRDLRRRSNVRQPGQPGFEPPQNRPNNLPPANRPPF